MRKMTTTRSERDAESPSREADQGPGYLSDSAKLADPAKLAVPADAADVGALAGILDTLDYYQILGVKRESSLATIRSAYQRQSRNYYPDRYLSHPSKDIRTTVNSIAKRIKEAYAVLRHPVKRGEYDRVLNDSSNPGRIRYTQETVQQAKLAGEEDVGKTLKGREYIKIAEEEDAKGNVQGALRNVKTALAYEPDNARYLELQEKLKKSQRGIRPPG